MDEYVARYVGCCAGVFVFGAVWMSTYSSVYCSDDELLDTI